jgi:septal ring factor EnvC (AmiA/AmiB activator)
MARTLAEIDADLTKVENRITNLTQAGQALTARLEAAETALDNLRQGGVALGNRVDRIDGRVDNIAQTGQETVDQIRRQFRTIRRGAHVLKTEIVSLTAKVNGEPEPPVRPGRNPLVKKVLVRGKLVARSRLKG